MKFKKGSIKKFAFILLLTVVSLQIFKYCKAYYFLYNSDVIVRVHFRGLWKWFHPKYDYYLVGTNASCKISESMAKKHFGEGIEERNMDDDQDIVSWSVGLDYSGGRNYDFNKSADEYLRTPFGDQYRLGYCESTRHGAVLNERDMRAMQQAAEALFDGDIVGKWVNDGEGFSVASFMLIRNGDKYLVEANHFYKRKPGEELLLRITENGDVKKVLELSEGYLDCYYFYNKDDIVLKSK